MNENLDWESLKTRFDPEPEGNSLGMVLYEEDGDGSTSVVEAFGSGCRRAGDRVG